MQLQLSEISTNPPDLFNEESAKEELKVFRKKISKYQEAMMAEQKKSLLIVVQGMDASGKDGTVKHVFTEINPSGVNVKSFKAPSDEEYSHDFLWRIYKEVPAKGKIQIFNRSHYEDILVPTVHKLFPEHIIKKRYAHINAFEENLKDAGTTIVKFYLHVSEKEQQRRFKKRMGDKHKLWKFRRKDVNESKHWHEYMEVYEKIFYKCPGWIIIPADNKHYRNFLIAQHIVAVMKRLKFKYPEKIMD